MITAPSPYAVKTSARSKCPIFRVALAKREGYAAQFNGVDQWLNVGDSTVVSTGDIDVFIGGWVYLNSLSGTTSIASQWTTTGSQQAYDLRYSSNHFQFVVSGNGSSSTTVQSVDEVGAGVWYYVLGWHDPSGNTIHISVNGVSSSTARSTGIFDSNAAFIVGSRNAGADGFFNGRIQQVCLWKAALTSDMRTALYGNGRGLPISRFSAAGITAPTAAWELSEESGSRADSFGGQHLSDNGSVTRVAGKMIGTSSQKYFCTSRGRTKHPAVGAEILANPILDQRVEPENGRFPVYKLTFDLVDIDDKATAAVSSGIVGNLVEFYGGDWDLDWASSESQAKLFSGIVAEIAQDAGLYHVTALSRTAAAVDKLVFNGASSRLTAGISDTDTAMTVEDASAFEPGFPDTWNEHAVAMIDDEIIIINSRSGNTFNITRTSTFGYAVPPWAGPAASHDEGAQVQELIHYGSLGADNANYANDELHPMENLKKVFLQPGKRGIADAGILTDDTQLDAAKAAIGPNVQMRFIHDESTNAKKFTEEQIYLPCAGYPLESANGELGIKLLGSASDATVVGTITDRDILELPLWLRNSSKIVTTVSYRYDYMPTSQRYQSTFVYKDETVISELGREVTLEIDAKGVRAYFENQTGTQEWFGETADFLLDSATRYVDRFGGVAPVISVRTGFSKHLFEVGDDIFVDFSNVPNLPDGTRSFRGVMEIIAMHTDFTAGVIDFELLGYPS